MNFDNIILTGFMGSGKSTVGRTLIKEINEYYFLDTDSLIEHKENRLIKDMFTLEGEAFFRDREKELFHWIKEHISHAVISTGGGLPMYISEIKEAGAVFYLYVPFDTIIQRLSREESEKRPLLSDLSKAKALYDKRDEVYEKLADYTIVNESIETTVSKIKEIHANHSNSRH